MGMRNLKQGGGGGGDLRSVETQTSPLCVHAARGIRAKPRWQAGTRRAACGSSNHRDNRVPYM